MLQQNILRQTFTPAQRKTKRRRACVSHLEQLVQSRDRPSRCKSLWKSSTRLKITSGGSFVIRRWSAEILSWRLTQLALKPSAPSAFRRLRRIFLHRRDMNGVSGRKIKRCRIDRAHRLAIHPFQPGQTKPALTCFPGSYQNSHTQYQAEPHPDANKMLKSPHIWGNLLTVVPLGRQKLMGFRVQPNLWQCGPYALKHALIMLGILVDERKITKIARSNGAGTDERSLARAARRFNCDLKEIRLEEPDDARKELTAFLREGIPCLLCVHQWKHWVAVVKERER